MHRARAAAAPPGGGAAAKVCPPGRSLRQRGAGRREHTEVRALLATRPVQRRAGNDDARRAAVVADGHVEPAARQRQQRLRRGARGGAGAGVSLRVHTPRRSGGTCGGRGRRLRTSSASAGPRWGGTSSRGWWRVPLSCKSRCSPLLRHSTESNQSARTPYTTHTNKDEAPRAVARLQTGTRAWERTRECPHGGFADHLFQGARCVRTDFGRHVHGHVPDRDERAFAERGVVPQGWLRASQAVVSREVHVSSGGGSRDWHERWGGAVVDR